MNLSKEDISWIVIVDGEILHEADTKEKAMQWAEKENVEPDRVASKIPMDGYIWA